MIILPPKDVVNAFGQMLKIFVVALLEPVGAAADALVHAAA
jgi:hypothetical protein